ncbi:hypothetical protein Cob_v010633 [Colletotrichum orbiculare MAFF 240422]|uniref:Cyclin-like f-box protein n=2 Tax=Colletotrichum orbiculare species complex TaxID=2707354 RepID=N4VDP3_COLOR|nr:hypothetical protein Cob_v010633 [Colletotrichum orbiculare MAFF 240422]TDZ36706.1 hypothetical protein C8035_v005049 [Colletotrichum spinosum]
MRLRACSSWLAFWLTLAHCAPNPMPQQQGGETAADKAKKIPQGVSKAKDGSIIMDATEKVNGMDIRFRISGPAGEFTRESKVPGGGKDPNSKGSLGLHVLLHGDTGQSFFDMPNQGVKDNLAGVTILAPDRNLHWGGGRGFNRTNGVEHAKAVDDLVQNVLPKYMSFNLSNVYFTGVSGGSLMLSGYFIPAHIGNYAGNGVLLACGAMEPRVTVEKSAREAMKTTKIHYQTTKKELARLRKPLAATMKVYAQLGTDVGLKKEALNQLQTANNKPDAGHCQFDEKGFDSGVQLIVEAYDAIMQGGNGEVPGIGNVRKGVSGQELKFSGSG